MLPRHISWREAALAGMVMANRRALRMNTDYKGGIDGLITRVLDRI